MSSMNIREQRDAFINSLISEGLLDQQQFEQLLMLGEDGSGFLVEVIMLFCEDSERIIAELSELLDQPVVDFQKVDASVHQFKGSSSSIGAQKIKVACEHFRLACERHDKQECLRTLNVIKNEYHRLKANFNTIVQLSSQC